MSILLDLNKSLTPLCSNTKGMPTNTWVVRLAGEMDPAWTFNYGEKFPIETSVGEVEISLCNVSRFFSDFFGVKTDYYLFNKGL